MVRQEKFLRVMISPQFNKMSRIFFLMLSGLVIMPLGACSTFDNFNPFVEKYQTKLLPDIPAEELYNQGLARLNNGDDSGAAKKFQDLEKQYPYSQWSKKGLLMTAYAQYKGGEYDDAVQTSNRYVTLYPATDDTAYAFYIAANSYYDQVLDISRDQDRANKALKLFGDLIDKFPKSEYVVDARLKIQAMKDQLAGKEMSIGRFYLQRRNYTAAINRFREVLAKYQQTRHTEEALERLTEAYLGLGINNEAQTAAAILGHNFPDGQWYKDAFALLKNGGLEPHEDQGSWMSKLFKTFLPG